MAEPRILLFSSHHRDALSAMLAAEGWRVEAARQAEGFPARAQRMRADIVMVDGRGNADEALATLRDIDCTARPVLALFDRSDGLSFGAAVEIGVAGVLGSPFSLAELNAAIRLAGRRSGQVSVLAPSVKGRDPLTGLAGPGLARSWIAEHSAAGAVSLMLVSPTNFGMINTAFGSETGDAVLRALAQRIEPLVAEIEGADTLFARLAGTEFAIAITGEVPAERLQIIAQAVADTVERPFSDGKDVIRLGCRIGIAQSSLKDRSAAGLMRRANHALADAREPEQNPIRFLSADAAGAKDFMASLQSDLRSALVHGEIEVLYQPQVSIRDSRIVGVEALARWHHPRHGEIGAVTLFAVAEQSDYLVELSRHVQQRALEQAAGWPPLLSGLRVAVNVTAADMARPGFREGFLAMLAQSGMPAGRVTVEMTESGLMQDLKASSETLSLLRAAGCRVAIDDFGTGYSSLAYLKSLPADYLKIDKGLADDISPLTRGSVIVRGVIDLARSLGLTVIAEGVETETQLAHLRDAGCAIFQGFLCAPALTTEKLLALAGSEG